MLKTPKRLSHGKTPSHARAVQQEKETAKRIGGRTTPGSGSGNEKGDVRLRGFTRIECKTTKKKSFSVTTAMMDKIQSAAIATGEVPFLQVELLGGGVKVVVMPDWVLDDLIDILRRK